MSRSQLEVAERKPGPNPADGLLSMMGEIDEAIRESNAALAEVEGRSWGASLIASDRDDLVKVSRAQGRINDLMIEMMNQIIVVNTMGYAYLVSVIDEFDRSVNNGWIDSEGKVQKLSESGRNFAAKATTIFNAILDGSRATQEKIESQAAAIDELEERMRQVVEIGDRQHRSLVLRIEELGGRVNDLAQTGESAAQATSALRDLIRRMMDRVESGRLQMSARELSIRKWAWALALGTGASLAGVLALGLFVLGTF